MFSVRRKDKRIPFAHRICHISIMHLYLSVQYIAKFLPLMGLIYRHGLSGLQAYKNGLQAPALGRRNQPGDAVAILVFFFKIIFLWKNDLHVVLLMEKIRKVRPQAFHNPKE